MTVYYATLNMNITTLDEACYYPVIILTIKTTGMDYHMNNTIDES